MHHNDPVCHLVKKNSVGISFCTFSSQENKRLTDLLQSYSVFIVQSNKTEMSLPKFITNFFVLKNPKLLKMFAPVAVFACSARLLLALLPQNMFLLIAPCFTRNLSCYSDPFPTNRCLDKDGTGKVQYD